MSPALPGGFLTTAPPGKPSGEDSILGSSALECPSLENGDSLPLCLGQWPIFYVMDIPLVW